MRLFVACCLASILRLYAPDPPFEETDLSRVFSLFVQQLKGLSEPSGVYYAYHFYLLESLATVKSVVLVWSLGEEDEGRDTIVTDICRLAFDLVHPKLSKAAHVYLVELIDAVIGECPSNSALPSAVLELVLEAVSQETEAHRAQFAGELLRCCSDRLSPMIAFHLANNEKATAIIHKQLVHVARWSTKALYQVATLLEQEFTAEENEIRTMAVQTAGSMFVVAPSLPGELPSLWSGWLARRYDRLAGIRAHWIALACRLILDTSSSITADLTAALTDKLLDPDERVRERVINAFAECGKPELLPRSLLEAIAQRCLDLKEDVRLASLQFLQTLMERVETDQSDWSFIPRTLLPLVFTEDRDSRILFEYFLEHSILTPTEGDSFIERQAARWLWLWSGLDNTGQQAFRKWVREKAFFVKLTQAYLHLLQMDGRQKLGVLQHLSDRFRDPLQAQRALEQIAPITADIAKVTNPAISPLEGHATDQQHYDLEQGGEGVPAQVLAHSCFLGVC